MERVFNFLTCSCCRRRWYAFDEHGHLVDMGVLDKPNNHLPRISASKLPPIDVDEEEEYSDDFDDDWWEEATFGAGCYWGTERYMVTKLQQIFPESIVDYAVGFMSPYVDAIENPKYS